MELKERIRLILKDKPRSIDALHKLIGGPRLDIVTTIHSLEARNEIRTTNETIKNEDGSKDHVQVYHLR